MINLELEKDRLNEFFIKAVILHLLVLILVYILDTLMGMNLFGERKVDLKVDIVQEAVRVDIVGLPKHTLQELKKMDLREQGSAPEEKQDEKINETSKVEFKKQAKKVNLSNLLNNLSQKKVVKKTKKKKKNKINQNQLNKLILEGNMVSKGSSTYGDVTKESQAKFISYIQSLPDKVRPFWKLPSYLLNMDLRCRLKVYLSSSGQVLKTEVFESSGEVEYDKKAQEAVKAVGSFQRPDPEILPMVTAGKIILGFPL